jgi:hypothetical protein
MAEISKRHLNLRKFHWLKSSAHFVISFEDTYYLAGVGIFPLRGYGVISR